MIRRMLSWAGSIFDLVTDDEDGVLLWPESDWREIQVSSLLSKVEAGRVIGG